MQKIGQRQSANHKIYETTSWKFPKFIRKTTNSKYIQELIKKNQNKSYKTVVEKISRSRSRGT